MSLGLSDIAYLGVLQEEGDNFFDVSTAVFLQSFSPSAQAPFVRGMAWNDTGSKMYVLSVSSSNVHEYNLSTNFDVSTAVFLQSFSVSAQETFPQGMAWNDTGSKMYVIGSSNDNVNEYNLSTNFDVSTAVFLQSFSVSAQETFPQGMAWNDTGSKMYVIGSSNDNVNEYNLSTNFDVSTAVFLQSFSVSAQETFPQGMAWNDTGSKMYVIGSSNDNVNEYNLSTNFDVSTAVFLQSFSVSAQETFSLAIVWNNDGSKMYVTGSSNDNVNEYDVG